MLALSKTFKIMLNLIYIGNFDPTIVENYKAMFDNIKNCCETVCELGEENIDCGGCFRCKTVQDKGALWKQKNFEMDERFVLPIKTKEENGKFELEPDSISLIKKTFDDLISSDKPHVFIFASCWSFFSEINSVLRASGLISALFLSKERYDITEGRMFKLNEDQKHLLELATKEEKKDVIITGKDTILCTESF